MTTATAKLSDLLNGIVSVSVDKDLDVSSITLNSREAEKGSLFVALKGTQQHGLAYAGQAQDAGAVAVIWESDKGAPQPDLEIPLFEIEQLRDVLGLIADRFYGSASHDLNLIGITGTDGKTSVSHFLAQSMDDCAVIGTIGLGMLDKLQKASHTTPDVLSVHKILAEMKQSGVSTVAMEVSSHALDQGRVDNVAFDVAVLTNLSRDHLDYHKTLEAYAEAKAKLFSWPELKVVVLNLDDRFGRSLIDEKSASRAEGETMSERSDDYPKGGLKSHASLKNSDIIESSVSKNETASSLKKWGGVLIGYGIGPVEAYPQGSLVAEDAQFTESGITASLYYRGQSKILHAPVLGRFNLSNLLAALAAMLGLGMSLDEAVVRLSNVKTVAGRMQKVSGENNDFLVVIDYAHTPNALETVLKALREHTQNKLICVFGCGGDRDAGKRPLMAQAAEQNADVVIVTDDNPRSENPEQIMQEIVAGFEAPELAMIEHDRARAIQLALTQAQTGDAVLIAGKGHESVQILVTGTVPFNDSEQASKVLQELAA